MLEKIAVQCLKIRFSSLKDPQFRIDNIDLEDQPVMGYNFGNRKLFTFNSYEDPISQKKLFGINALSDSDANSKYEVARLLSLEGLSNNTILEFAILPLCFNRNNTTKTFVVGQDVVKAVNVESEFDGVAAIGMRFSSMMFVEFGKIKRILPSGAIKIVLDDIPGQVEVCYEPVLLGPKIEVIPLLL